MSDDELQRLAAQGRANAKHVPVEVPRAVNRKDEAIRLSLCRVYMPPARRAALAAAAIGGLLVIAAYFVQLVADPALATGIGSLGLVLIVGGLIGDDALKRVTPEQLEMERAWVSGLPFRLDGYFDILAQPGEKECRVFAVYAWAPGGPEIDHGIVLDVWHALDPRAESRRGPHGELAVRSGPIAAQGRRGRVLITYGNGNVAPYVHRLVNRVLLPLHRRRALSSVTIHRA